MTKLNVDKRIAQIFIEERYSKTKIYENLRKFLIDRYSEDTDLLDKACDALQEYFNKFDSYYPAKQRRLNFLFKWLFEQDEPEIDLIFTILIPILSAQYKSESNRKIHVPYQVPVLALASLIHNDEWEAPSTNKKNKGTFTAYTRLEAITQAAELISVICESDLYDVWSAGSSPLGSMSITSNIKATQEELEYFHNIQYLPPMICPPETISKNNDGSGYLTIKDHVILNKLNRHKENLALDALNIINKTALSLDLNILEMEEKPNKPLDTLSKRRAFNKWKESSRKIYDEILNHGNAFYFTHKFDDRGRMYTQGYHINIQSMDYKKALISLNHKEVIS